MADANHFQVAIYLIKHELTSPLSSLLFQSQEFQNKLDEILDMISEPQESPGGTPRKARIEEQSVPIYEMQFPDLFVY